MKIAFLTPEYPHPQTGTAGGIGTSIKNLALGLIQEGVVVSILVYGQSGDGFFEEDGLAVYRIKNRKLKGLSWYLTRKKIEKKINELYVQQKIDLVEAADWTGITSFIRPKCPMVVKLHGSDTYFCHLDKRPVKWNNRFHEKRALQNADALVSVSQYTADLTKELFGLDREFTVIPNGIDSDQFEPQIESPIAGNLLYFGTLIRKKGLLELPLIFNELHARDNRVQLTLVGRDNPDVISGNPSTWQMMQALFTKEALTKVNYVGSVPYSDIRKYINDAAVCVFPTFAEALPVSWIEAMAMEKAIVASNIGWATEIIENGVDGFLVYPQEHIKYAEAIFKLLQQPEMQRQIGIAARVKVIRKFSLGIVARQSADFYKKYINEN